jgi:hypothetical protein
MPDITLEVTKACVDMGNSLNFIFFPLHKTTKRWPSRLWEGHLFYENFCPVVSISFAMEPTSALTAHSALWNQFNIDAYCSKVGQGEGRVNMGGRRRSVETDA